VVTVDAPGRHAAVAVARAIVSDALKHQAPASQPTSNLHRPSREGSASVRCLTRSWPAVPVTRT